MDPGVRAGAIAASLLGRKESYSEVIYAKKILIFPQLIE
jgi:hypothetical protein